MGMGGGFADAEGTRASRARAQLLHRRWDGGVVDGVRRLLAVQAQDPAAFPLALRARMPGLTALELAEARETGLVVRCWGPRGTLHLIAADDLDWLHPLVKPAPAGSLRRLRQLGLDVDVDTAVSVTESALAGQGPLTKPELGERLAAAGLPAQGQAIVHLAMLAAGRGQVVLGPERGGKATYVHSGDWLGRPVPTDVPDRAAAMRRLAARYLVAHAPAEPSDLAAWSGLPLGEVEHAWRALPTGKGTAGSSRAEADREPSVRLTPNLAEPIVRLTPSFAEPIVRLTPSFAEADGEPIVRLIPSFDEYLLGWRNRDHAVAGSYRTAIHPGGGVIRSALLVDGRAIGTWRARRTAGRVDLAVEPFEPLAPAVLPGIAAESAGIGAFLGLRTRLTIVG
jgi:hypothetical protein